MPLEDLFNDPRWPQARAWQPYMGVPDLGMGPLGSMVLQGVLGPQMGRLGMLPGGLSDTSMLDRLRQADFTRRHDEFVRQQAEMDRLSYLRTARGVAAMTGTPWGADQMAAANSLAGGAIALSPTLVTMAPMALDAMAGQRGSSAVMAHFMHLGGRQRIDPNTGRMGMTEDALRQLTGGVFQELFAGNNYLQTPLSAGRAGMLFQELQLRGMAPGMASLDMLGRESMLQAYRTAGVSFTDSAGRVRELSSLSGEERSKVYAAAEPSLRQMDSKRVAGSLRDWGKAVEAMREIFGDAGAPDAPMPALINALNQLSGGGMGKLNPHQISDLVRTTNNLAKQTGIGLDAAVMMTQQAMGEALASGLDPVFGARAAQHSLAFMSAYQGMGVGAYHAWGRGDMMAHQQQSQRLMLRGAASQSGNQLGLLMRLDALQKFGAGTDAGRLLQAAMAGETTFMSSTGRRSIDLEEGEFASLVAGSGSFNRGQVLGMLQQTSANQEFLFNSTEAQQAIRASQGREFRERQSPLAASAAAAFAKERLGGLYDPGKMTGVMSTLGGTAIDAFMDSSAGVATDRRRRNRAMGAAMERKLREAAAAGDEGARTLLADLDIAGDKDSFLASMAESIYGTVDQRLRDTGEGTLQDRHVLHSDQLLRRSAREQGRARIDAMLQEAMAPLGKGGLLRRGMEALMGAQPGDDLTKIMAEAIGGTRGRDIAAAIGSGRMGELSAIQAELQGLEAQHAAAGTADERQRIFSVMQERTAAWQEQMARTVTALDRQGLLTDAKVEQRDVARVIRHSKHVAGSLAGMLNLDPEMTAMRDRLAGAGVLEADAGLPEMFGLSGRELMDAGLSAAEIKRVGELRGKWTDARRDLRGDQANVDDLVAKLLGDEAGMLGLGSEGLSHVRGLRDVQRQLETLAGEKYGGRMDQAMASKEGQDLLAFRDQYLNALHGMLGGKSYEYLGADKAQQLRDIAARLGDGTTMVDLLSMDDAVLDQQVADGKISGEEAASIKDARGRRAGVEEEYRRLQEEIGGEATETAKSTLVELTGDATLAKELLDSDQGRQLAGLLGGTGAGAAAGRAWLSAARRAAKERQALEQGGVTAAERGRIEELRAEFGAAVDVQQGDGTEAGGSTDVNELLPYLLEQIRKRSEEADEGGPEGGGQRHYSIGRLIVHRDGSAEFDLGGQDPRGP